jgi:hypothetical protein
VNLLDRVADWVRQVLSFGSAQFVAGAWLPIFAVVVFVALMLVVRKVVPLAGRGGAVVIDVLFTVVGAALLVPDLVVASAWRGMRGRPPALLYHYGDAVAATTAGVTRRSGVVAAGLARVARMHWFLVVLLCGGLIWTWNHAQCPATTSARAVCVRPVTGWVDSFGDEKPAPPVRKGKPAATTGPARRKS